MSEEEVRYPGIHYRVTDKCDIIDCGKKFTECYEFGCAILHVCDEHAKPIKAWGILHRMVYHIPFSEKEWRSALTFEGYERNRRIVLGVEEEEEEENE